jgi:hypothetical protein
MKRILQIAAFTFGIVLFSNLRSTAQPSYYGGVTYQTFYDELSPYGRWIDYPEHGFVWMPDAGPGFRPYSTNGYWVWTDAYGWMWTSDYDWGWAPFHYGRWFYDSFYGWLWVPGFEWSPAWVVWRHGGDYYGWAPLRPGIHINVSFSIGRYSPPVDYWCFAPRRYITSRNLHNYYIDRRQNITIINQTTIINNYNYNRNVFVTGPSRYEAERYTGRITPVRFRESDRPGRAEFRNNEMSVFKPRIQREDNRQFAPQRAERFNRQPEVTDRRKMDDKKWGVPEERNSFDRNNQRDNSRFTMPENKNRNGNNKPDDISRNNRFEPIHPNQDNRNSRPFERKEPQIKRPDNQNQMNRNNDNRVRQDQNSVREFPGRNNEQQRNEKPRINNNSQNQQRPFTPQVTRPQQDQRNFESRPQGNPGQGKSGNNDGERGGKRKD